MQAVVNAHAARGCGIERVRLEHRHMATLEGIIEGFEGAMLAV